MEFLKELTHIDGVSGNEEHIAEALKKALESFCCKVEINKAGSVIAYLKQPDNNKKTILLEAHMDKIGLAVSEISEGGFLKFKALGGVDERTLPASEVCILGKEQLYGVIGALPPHLKAGAKDDNNIKIENMLIDTGLSRDTLAEQVSVGDAIVLRSEFCELSDGRASSAALDNRAGICAVLKAARQLAALQTGYNIKIAFTVGEELGLLGARTIDCSDVDLCFVVDVTHGHTPDAKAAQTAPLGSGAAICRGPNLDYKITNRVIDLAEAADIPYTIETAPGNTGTNAWVIQTLEMGVRCVLLSIPLRYMHTVVETVDTADIDAVAELITKCIEGGDLFA